jgi:hypothetical protein
MSTTFEFDRGFNGRIYPFSNMNEINPISGNGQRCAVDVNNDQQTVFVDIPIYQQNECNVLQQVITNTYQCTNTNASE